MIVVALIIFTQNSLLQMPSCHIMLQAKEKQVQAWEERFHLGIFRGFCSLKWFWIHLAKNKYFVVFVTDCTCLQGCHDQKSLFGFFVSLMVRNLHDLGSIIQSWILLKKRALRLSSVTSVLASEYDYIGSEKEEVLNECWPQVLSIICRPWKIFGLDRQVPGIRDEIQFR